MLGRYPDISLREAREIALHISGSRCGAASGRQSAQPVPVDQAAACRTQERSAARGRAAEGAAEAALAGERRRLRLSQADAGHAGSWRALRANSASRGCSRPKGCARSRVTDAGPGCEAASRRSWRRTTCSASSPPTGRTSPGSPTSPTSARTKAGCTWPWSSTCGHAWWWAGR